jgi:hypothetical protein
MSLRYLMRRQPLPAIVAIAVAGLAMTASSVTARSVRSSSSAEAALASAAGGARTASASAAGPMLGGFTNQGWPVVIELSSDKRRIIVAEAGLEMSCTSGAQFAVDPYLARIPIARNGRFSASATIPPSPGNPVSLTGGSESFSGRLNRARTGLTGTWRLHLDFAATDGSTDHCDTGRVPLSARL